MIPDLDDYLLALPAELLTEMNEKAEELAAFVVDDDEKAAWAARKAARARAEVERIEAQAQAETERIVEWARDASGPHRRDFEFFEGLLLGYLHRLTEEKGDNMPDTYKVLGADLKRRKQPDTIVFEDPEDEAAFVQWALSNNLRALRMTPNKQLIKDEMGDMFVIDPELDEKGKPKPGQVLRIAVGVTGEQVPGVVYRVGEKKPSVQITRSEP